jgi:nucleotide-binding universal stress UspA family protein
MEKEIKNILVPMNFSNACDQAIETGVAMCKRHGAALHLLEVKKEQRFVYPTGRSAQLIAMRLQSHMAELNFMETYAREIAKEHHIDCYYHLLEGPFARTVAEVAADFYCDLIILEQDKSDTLYSTFLNPSPGEIIRATDCPVMTLPRNSFSTDFKSISFPVWAKKAVLGKLEIAIPIIRKNDSRITLLGAMKNDNDPWELNMVEKLASSVQSLISSATDKIEKEVDPAPNTARKILARARKKGSDLLVISSSPNQGIKSVFTPTYTQQIIKNSTIPVISVKQPPAALRKL